MVQYTLIQSPEVVIDIPGKDSTKARDKAMDQLLELMEAGELPTDLSDGFGPQQFIEVKELSPVTTEADDAVNHAIQVLSTFATLKQKAQTLRAEARKVRPHLDTLLSEDESDSEVFDTLKEGFKTLKSFAQAHSRYQEARAEAQQSLTVLDQALALPEDD
ncbi:hypothetical protein IQ268_00065 [Oculatella sp. LEGE 06141]|uniref:hypothetical protein n=1 Tax=Oculatella sp. LEGE 06141 TaxID=1828648 RepID=UPI001881066D|nr:hypothetical protein [Oculatella sp. LEGE 06141]MBE9176970.1 hypothetical protein [Oculatella sp. LEGE 06141]